MKLRKYFSLLVAMLLIFVAGSTVYSAGYDYSYYIDKVEYVDDYTIEATIMFTGDYGSTVDIETMCYLAVYDDTQEQMLNVSMKGYDFYKPFAETQRFSVKQRVEIPDLNRLRYRVEAILVTTNDMLTPSGFADNYNNKAILHRSDFYLENRIELTAKVDWVSLDPEEKYVEFTEIQFVNEDDAEKYTVGITGTTTSYFDTTTFMCMPKGDINFMPMKGLYVDLVVDDTDRNNPVILSAKVSDENKFLEIDAELFKGLNGNVIEYYTSENATTLNKNAKVENTYDNNGDGMPDAMNIYVNAVKIDYYDYYYDNGMGYYQPPTTVDVIISICNLNNNPNNQKYRFADTDNNGYYDTLFVDNYASFVVGKVLSDEYNIVADKTATVFNSNICFDAMVCDPYYDYDLTFDPEDTKVSYSLTDELGNPLQFSNIEVGDVVTYAMSTDGYYYYYDVMVNKSSVVNGTIDEVTIKNDKVTATQEYVYNIDGKEYRLNQREMVSSSSTSIFKAGMTSEFKVTPYGKIISYTDNSVSNFGIFVDAEMKMNSLSKNLRMQIMNTDGVIETLDFADVFNYGAVYMFEENVDINNFATDISNQGRLVMYELNSNGEVKELYFGSSIIAENADYKMKYLSGTYYAASNRLASEYIVDNSVLIAVDGTIVSTNDKTSYSKIEKADLRNGDMYNGVVVVNENREIVIALIENFMFEAEDVLYDGGDVLATDAYITSSSFTNTDTVVVSAIDSNGEEITLDMAENFTVNEKVYSVDSIASTEFNEIAEAIRGKFVKYYKNQYGENVKITAIEATVSGKLPYSQADSKLGDVNLTDETVYVNNDDGEFTVILKDGFIDSDGYMVSIITDENNNAKIVLVDGLNVNAVIDKEEISAMVALAVSTATFENKLQMLTVDGNGTVEILDFADEFKLNSQWLTSQTDYMMIYNEIVNSGRLVLYKLNLAGEIAELYYGNGISGDYTFNILSAGYSETDGSFGGIVLTDNSEVVGCDTILNSATIDKSSFSKIMTRDLADGEWYTGSVIVNENNEIQFVLIENFCAVPKYDSVPLFVTKISDVYVDDEPRCKVYGLVDGEEVSYVLASDLRVFEMGYSKNPAWCSNSQLSMFSYQPLRTGDVIQFTLNENEEIAIYRPLVKVDSTGTIINFLATNDAIDMMNNEYNDTRMMPAIFVSHGMGAMTCLSPANLFVKDMYAGAMFNTYDGFGAVGYVHNVKARTAGLFANITGPYSGTAAADEYYMNTWLNDNYVDIEIDSDKCLYSVSENYADGYAVKTMDSIKTYDSQGSLSKTDDLLYIFKYNGEVILQYSIDTRADNK